MKCQTCGGRLGLLSGLCSKGCLPSASRPPCLGCSRDIVGVSINGRCGKCHNAWELARLDKRPTCEVCGKKSFSVLSGKCYGCSLPTVVPEPPPPSGPQPHSTWLHRAALGAYLMVRDEAGGMSSIIYLKRDEVRELDLS